MAGGVGQVFDCMRTKRGPLPSMATYLSEILTYNGPFVVAVARSQREAHLPLAATFIELATLGGLPSVSRRPVIRGAEAHGLTESVLAHTQTRAHTRLRTAYLSIFTQCDRRSRE